MNAFDAAVVGSGPNGLCAAIVLAQSGLRVVVYEAHDTVGGGARTASSTLSGFRHDVCSSVHPMALAAPWLRAQDLASHGLSWCQPTTPSAHALDDGAALLHRSLDDMVTSLGSDGAAWRSAFEPLVHNSEAIFDAALGPPSFGAPMELARLGWLAMRSVQSLADRFERSATRALLAGVGAHSILPLDKTPSAAITVMLTLAGHTVGWPMPRGGAQALPDALASMFEATGGLVRTGVTIDHLDQIETSGPVLFETAPRDLVRIAGDALPDRYKEALGRYRHGPGLFKVDWALAEPIPWADPGLRRAGTVHCGGSFEEVAASEAAVWRGEVAERGMVLLVQPSVCDPTRAPDGRAVAWGYVHTPPGDTRDRTDAIEAQVERFAPGFRDTVLARATVNAAELEAYNPTYVGGDVIGGVADLPQAFARPVLRLDPWRTPNPRLFLCSSSTPPGGGVHGQCGVNAAQCVLKTVGSRA